MRAPLPGPHETRSKPCTLKSAGANRLAESSVFDPVSGIGLDYDTSIHRSTRPLGTILEVHWGSSLNVGRLRPAMTEP